MLMRPPEYIQSDHGAIKRKIDSDYTANQSLWQIFWTESTINTRLEAGDTSLMAEINSSMPNNNRGQWYFNRVRPLCNMVSGRQRQTRKSTVVVPLENADQKTADQWTKLIMGIYKRENVYETISEAFHQGACISGMNLLHVYIDWSNDPISGDIKVDNLAYNSFFIDPYFRKRDLSDCSFVWRRSYLSHSEAAALMPAEDYERVMSLPGNPTGTGRDGRFQYMPESYGQNQQNRLAYDEYWYRDFRKQKKLVDVVSGETLDISMYDEDEIDLDKFLLENPRVKLVEQNVPTVRLAIMIQDKVFYDGPNPLGIDIYPFIPVVGYYNPMMPYFYSRIQSICTSLRDPQMLYNRRVILNMDMAESLASSGFIFKENAPVDVKHLFQTGAGRIIPIKDEANISDIVPIQPPNIPPAFFQLSEVMGNELNFVSGITEANMGLTMDDNSSGYKEALRQSAGNTALEPLFDRLDFSQNLLGNVMMEIVRNNYTPGKVKLLLEGDEPQPLFYNKAFGKYHCTVENGFNTETQRQLQTAQLLELRKMGINIPDSIIIKSAALQNKQDLIDALEAQNQQSSQMQQQQAQVAMQELQARAELSHARAQADMGLYAERTSRVYENIEAAKERKAAAVKDEYIAVLNLVKAAREIGNMDINQIKEIMAMQHLLEDRENRKKEGDINLGHNPNDINMSQQNTPSYS